MCSQLPRLFLTLSLLVTVIVGYVPSVAIAADYVKPGVSLKKSSIIAATNRERERYEQVPLSASALLQSVAQQKAELMASSTEFAHTLNSGVSAWSLMREAGYLYEHAGENLAVHFVRSAVVVNAWMASPTHRENILSDKFTEIGIGIAPGYYDGYQGYFIVQLLASPLSEQTFVYSTSTNISATPHQ